MEVCLPVATKVAGRQVETHYEAAIPLSFAIESPIQSPILRGVDVTLSHVNFGVVVLIFDRGEIHYRELPGGKAACIFVKGKI
jgi:hypothetical protein